MSTVGPARGSPLDVVASVAPEGGHDTDPLWERRRTLFLLVVEPATLFEFASQSFDSGCLVTVADNDHLPGLEIDFPTFDPVVDIAFEDDLRAILEVGVHVPVAVRPDHTGELGLTIRERKIERSTVLVEIGDFSETADAVEGRRFLDGRCNPLVQLLH
jgi:hypothetical protein